MIYRLYRYLFASKLIMLESIEHIVFQKTLLEVGNVDRQGLRPAASNVIDTQVSR